MEKRYQVFISSTFADLEDVRREIMQNILELNCFPAGMEMFPATNGSQFEHIKKVIDQSDYYILIIAGRYGSVNEEGISYTEMEYDYAKSKGIPILVFAREDIDSLPVNKTDNDSVKREKLEAFKNKAMDNRLAKLWSNEAKLPGEVFKSLSKLFKEEPRVGWVRADSIEDMSKNNKGFNFSEAFGEPFPNLKDTVEDAESNNLEYELNKERTYKFNNDTFEVNITLLEVMKRLFESYETEMFNYSDFYNTINDFLYQMGYCDLSVTKRAFFVIKRLLVRLTFINEDEYNTYYWISEEVGKYIDDLILKGEY